MAATIAVLAVVFVGRASSSAAAKAAGDLSHVREEYRAAAGTLKRQTATFDSLITGAMQNQDLTELQSAADSLSRGIANFDVVVTDLNFPASMSGDKRAMFQADGNLLEDLAQAPGSGSSVDDITSWLSIVRDDYVAASAAHTALASDLGVPADSFAGAPNLAV